MSAETAINITNTRGLMEYTNSAIRRHSGYTFFDATQALFPVFGVLLGGIAMTSAFIFERATLFIGT